MTGENYGDANNIAYQISGWYCVIFMLTICIGCFFIGAFFVEAFAGSYEDSQAEISAMLHRANNRSLVAAMEIWSRHSSLSDALFGSDRNIKQSSSYENFTTQGLQSAAFFELMVTLEHSSDFLGGRVSWMADIERQLHGLVSYADTYSSAVEVILDVCAELSMHSLYEKLCTLAPSKVLMEDRRRMLLQSSGVSTQCKHALSYEEVQWARGHSPENANILEALQLLPTLKGLKEDCGTELHSGTTHLLQLVYLHKWCFHRVFGYMDKDAADSLIEASEFDQVLRLCQTVDALGESKTLRIDAERLVTESELEVLEHTARQRIVTHYADRCFTGG